MENKTINYMFLVKLGFPKATAQQIIRQTKRNLVQQGCTLYDNRRIGIVPVVEVEKIVGFRLLDEKVG